MSGRFSAFQPALTNPFSNRNLPRKRFTKGTAIEQKVISK